MEFYYNVQEFCGQNVISRFDASSADFVGSRNTRAPLFFKLCLNSFSFLFEKPKYKIFFPHVFRFHFAALSDCKITV